MMARIDVYVPEFLREIIAQEARDTGLSESSVCRRILLKHYKNAGDITEEMLKRAAKTNRHRPDTLNFKGYIEE